MRNVRRFNPIHGGATATRRGTSKRREDMSSDGHPTGCASCAPNLGTLAAEIRPPSYPISPTDAPRTNLRRPLPDARVLIQRRCGVRERRPLYVAPDASYRTRTGILTLTGTRPSTPKPLLRGDERGGAVPPPAMLRTRLAQHQPQRLRTLPARYVRPPTILARPSTIQEAVFRMHGDVDAVLTYSKCCIVALDRGLGAREILWPSETNCRQQASARTRICSRGRFPPALPHTRTQSRRAVGGLSLPDQTSRLAPTFPQPTARPPRR
ncbi:hypothetical protein C8Q77DRAFT_18093 [Trametes polyzona]|nr:hypothetical protein C8Q77DRAFT_18093 [Trametes polyzona]